MRLGPPEPSGCLCLVRGGYPGHPSGPLPSGEGAYGIGIHDDRDSLLRRHLQYRLHGLDGPLVPAKARAYHDRVWPPSGPDERLYRRSGGHGQEVPVGELLRDDAVGPLAPVRCLRRHGDVHQVAPAPGRCHPRQHGGAVVWPTSDHQEPAAVALPGSWLERGVALGVAWPAVLYLGRPWEVRDENLAAFLPAHPRLRGVEGECPGGSEGVGAPQPGWDVACKDGGAQ